ncbi:hypothetical protein FJ881_10855 [Escherichia albertii]|uniref:Uncharacterized protein n=3 Tax=Escherichia TaxID=561 RepID=A0A789MBL0_ECOLX|nr:NTF2 fold immunity protein [Escherichia albertii]EEU9600108.1 hypothetical protein [Escherichia albertii]EEW0765746.1 hypothetical protein [Escherichia albertii]EEW0789578.1 hypothetical protein [Escherichia albertii]EEW6712385.1 hypothetical protein [Escherichia albertii]EEX2834121.1 hypothetical protein [Escherichia albertii]
MRFLFIIFSISSCVYSSEQGVILFTKDTGNYLVYSQKMASELAEVYVRNIYGADVSEKEKPYNVEDKKDYWLVTGTIPSKVAGGVFIIEIKKNTGEVYTFSHGE